MGSRVPYDLPVELLTDILTYTIEENPRPNDALAVNSVFHDVGVALLYTRLRFRTVRQLSLFAASPAPVPVPPRHVEVRLSGGTAGFLVFRDLAEAFRKCSLAQTVNGAAGNDNACNSLKSSGSTSPLPLDLDSLSLCLNSHSSNPYLHYVYKALKLVNPRRFTWLGPDPSHHFSTAIVPTATLFLFGAMAEWSNVEHITLTNISFPSDIPLSEDSDSSSAPQASSLYVFPTLPRLRVLYIGQATRLLPSTIAHMLFMPGQDSLERIQLVDAYKQSIWGSRVRRRDVEKAALALPLDLAPETIVERVKALVRCEAKTERIMGGDRVEGTSSLE